MTVADLPLFADLDDLTSVREPLEHSVHARVEVLSRVLMPGRYERPLDLPDLALSSIAEDADDGLRRRHAVISPIYIGGARVARFGRAQRP